MIIDIIYVALLVLAIFKGFSKGFIIAVFSFLALFIGLAAALKLSAAVAAWLGKSTTVSERWLPVLAFAAVLVAVAVATRLVAVIIEKSLRIVMLGFVNKLAGIVLYIAVYTLIFSIVLFYATKISLLKNDAIAGSYFYRYVQPLGPKSMALLSSAIPLFKNMFQQLEHFFGRVAEKSK